MIKSLAWMDSTVPNLEWYRHKCYKKIIFYFTLLSLFYSTFSLFSHISISLPSASLSLSQATDLCPQWSPPTNDLAKHQTLLTSASHQVACLYLYFLSFSSSFTNGWESLSLFGCLWLILVIGFGLRSGILIWV